MAKRRRKSLRRRKNPLPVKTNPGVGGWLVLVGVAAGIGGLIWWLRSRDKKASADQVAMLQAAQKATAQVLSAVPTAANAASAAAAATAAATTGASSFGAPTLTPAQVAEMNRYPETRHGAGHFNGDPAEAELYANTGAGHF